MKPLITTQLIEEYQKRIVLLNNLIDDSASGSFDRALFAAQRNELQSVVYNLQSKQSKERQNIVDVYKDGWRNRGDLDTYEMTAEDYFNQTFKQEQK